MKRFLHLIIYCLLIVAAVVWLHSYPGTILINWFGYEIQITIAFAVIILLCLALAVYILRIPLSFVRWVKESIDSRSKKNQEVFVERMLKSYLSGDTKQSMKLIVKAEKVLKDRPELKTLLDALINPNAQIFNDMLQKEDMQLAAVKGLVALHQQKGEIKQALDLCQKALPKNKDIAWLVSATLQLEQLNEQWEKSLETLELARKLHIVDERSYATQKANVLLRLDRPYEAFKAAPWMSEAAVLSAKMYPKKGDDILQTAWENNPNWSVYEAYKALYARKDVIGFYQSVHKLTDKNKTARLNYLVLADAAINASLWNEARKELTAYLDMYTPTPLVAMMMAIIEAEENRNFKEAKPWIDMIKHMKVD